MTILAGIYSRDPGLHVTDAQVHGIRQAISRHPGEAVDDYRSAEVYLAKVDIGALGAPAFAISDRGSVAMLAGEPLLGKSDRRGTRSADLQMLHRRWDSREWGVLRDTRGVFCAVYYDPTDSTLTLLGDKFGIRPIYFWSGARHVIFATALRILEGLAEVEKTLDLRGAAESLHFGYPLGSRTMYREVSVLQSAELVQFRQAFATRQRYWRWDRLPPWDGTTDDLLRTAYSTFNEAVRRRLRGDRVTLSLLSGGLDSRCIVGVLRHLGATVHTFNFSIPQTQDQAFARAFAQASGAVHHEAPAPPAYRIHIEQNMRTTWAAVSTQLAIQPERPAMVWAGDGGSVSVGHVYVHPRVVEQLRAGFVDEAIETYFRLEGMGMPRRLLARRVAKILPHLPRQGLRDELGAIECAELGDAFHLFLMFNDQRRHLAQHFEDIDLYRIEYHLPFFDSAFLETILSAPLEFRMRHHLYVEWLAHFPRAVAAVPWQAYPGHRPCPLPIPEGLRYQWDGNAFPELRRIEEGRLLTAVAAVLSARDFPHALLRRGRLRVAAWAHQLGLRDYRFVFGTARTLFDMWRRCGGRIEAQPSV